ncbi:MAG: TyeA family type III secretion system gatekeeper subunit [Pseudomonadota bacterium]
MVQVINSRVVGAAEASRNLSKQAQAQPKTGRLQNGFSVSVAPPAPTAAFDYAAADTVDDRYSIPSDQRRVSTDVAFRPMNLRAIADAARKLQVSSQAIRREARPNAGPGSPTVRRQSTSKSEGRQADTAGAGDEISEDDEALLAPLPANAGKGQGLGKKAADQQHDSQARDAWLAELESRSGLPEDAAQRLKMLRSAGNWRESTTRYLGWQWEAAALEKGNSDDDVIALLTPVDGAEPQSAKEFTEMLVRQQHHPEAFQKMLADVLEDQDTLPRNDANALVATFQSTGWDPAKVMELIRLAQGIRPVAEWRDQRREELKEIIPERIRSLDGSRALASVSGLAAATRSSNLDTFLGMYTKLLEDSQNFLQSAQLLLASFSLPELLQTVDLIKKALADNLAAEIPSHEPARLNHLMKHMQEMHALSSVIGIVEREIVQRLEKSAREEPVPSLDTLQLVKGLIDMIASGYVLANHFANLAKSLNVPEGVTRIVFLTGVTETLRKVPLRVYEDDAGNIGSGNARRNEMTEAAGEALDVCIDETDEGDFGDPVDPRSAAAAPIDAAPLKQSEKTARAATK